MDRLISLMPLQLGQRLVIDAGGRSARLEENILNAGVKSCCSSRKCESTRKSLTPLSFLASTSFESGRLSSLPELLAVGGTAKCAAAGLHRSCAVYI
ncbi:hypothetical protein TNCV_2948481 [Trichonephila clavipes]|nr:hypothetical protein TNCV_2948481 [Trichonephila clavipes]